MNSTVLGTANSSCLAGSNPIQLAPETICLRGFWCPNNTAIHPPVYCPPTPVCQIERFAGKTCQPQGLYEPVICPAGFYCPPPGIERLECPAGYFCPEGTYDPRKCQVGSLCKAGSRTRLDVLGCILMLILDLLVLGITYWKKWKCGRRGKKTAGSVVAGPLQQDVEKEDVKSLRDDNVNMEGLGSAELKLMVESFERCIDGKHFGLRFDFQDLGLTLKNGKELLSGVNGTVERGSMWGVMGPSGAGKTTFMNVLMGKIDRTKGTLYVNGMRKDMKDYKRIIGYVPQDDILFAELTVRENILHSARIRLPKSWTASEINLHVERVISCLDLTHIQHSLVGDSMRPVISGGQRKRVNIGIELAAAPMVLFCDEPTSGLDSTAALDVVKLLQAVSKLGVTVVSVIHQPRTEIYDCLENIMLISKGKPCWAGPRVEMAQHVQDEGYVFKSSSNPADVIMDIISGQGFRHRSHPREDEVQHLITRWENIQPKIAVPADTDASEEESLALVTTVKKRGASWYKQAWFCFARSIVQQRRQINSFFLEIFVGALAGALMGLAVSAAKGQLFQGIYHSPFELLSSSINYVLIPEIGLMSGIAIALAGSPSGVKVFGEEKLIYWRETASGHSRSAYYIGKTLSTLPRITLSSLHFTALFMLLASPVLSFSDAYIVCFLNFFCIYGLAACVSMVTRKENGALLSVVVGMVVSVFCGYGPNLKQAKRWHLDWWWRMCPGTWFAEALYTKCLEPFEYLYDISDAAKQMGYTVKQFEYDLVGLVVIGIVYRIIAWAGLVGLKRDRQR